MKMKQSAPFDSNPVLAQAKSLMSNDFGPAVTHVAQEMQALDRRKRLMALQEQEYLQQRLDELKAEEDARVSGVMAEAGANASRIRAENAARRAEVDPAAAVPAIMHTLGTGTPASPAKVSSPIREAAHVTYESPDVVKTPFRNTLYLHRDATAKDKVLGGLVGGGVGAGLGLLASYADDYLPNTPGAAKWVPALGAAALGAGYGVWRTGVRGKREYFDAQTGENRGTLSDRLWTRRALLDARNSATGVGGKLLTRGGMYTGTDLTTAARDAGVQTKGDLQRLAASIPREDRSRAAARMGAAASAHTVQTPSGPKAAFDEQEVKARIDRHFGAQNWETGFSPDAKKTSGLRDAGLLIEETPAGGTRDTLLTYTAPTAKDRALRGLLGAGVGGAAGFGADFLMRKFRGPTNRWLSIAAPTAIGAGVGALLPNSVREAYDGGSGQELSEWEELQRARTYRRMAPQTSASGVAYTGSAFGGHGPTRIAADLDHMAGMGALPKTSAALAELRVRDSLTYLRARVTNLTPDAIHKLSQKVGRSVRHSRPRFFRNLRMNGTDVPRPPSGGFPELPLAPASEKRI